MWSSAPVLVVVAQEVSADSPHKYRIILTLLGPKFWRPNLNLGLLSLKGIIEVTVPPLSVEFWVQ